MSWADFDEALRWRVVWGAAILLAAIPLLIWAAGNSSNDNGKPPLALMTSLPLALPEGDISEIIGGRAEPAAAYIRLTENFDITPLDNLEQLNRERFDLLLLAQPRALSPAELARLQDWIGAGGRAVILADPALRWESQYALGDPRRPLFTSLLSPLFKHWGLELILPMDEPKASDVVVVDGERLQLAAAGAWRNTAGGIGASCDISAQEVLAECRIGAGKAILLADADMLDARHWQASGLGTLLGKDEFANMAWLTSELLAMSHK
ncbi:MAG: Gldg family protein [Sphingorhabdus sp.]